MTKPLLIAFLVSTACAADEHNPPSGGDSDDGASVEADATIVEADAAPVPDGAPGDVTAAEACEAIAHDFCESTIVCELYTPPPGQDSMPGCLAVHEPYCLERRAEPVPAADLGACLEALADQECGETMIIPGRCRYLWDTIVPDAGVNPDAGVDSGVPDAGLDQDHSVSAPDLRQPGYPG